MPTSYILVGTALSNFVSGQDDSGGRLEVKAGQILLLLNTSDTEWWRFKIKTDRQHNDANSGLVPKMLTQEAVVISFATASRDFVARVDGDLTIIEHEALSVYCIDGDWALVKGTLGAGYVPRGCVKLEKGIDQPNTPPELQGVEPKKQRFWKGQSLIALIRKHGHWRRGKGANHTGNTAPQNHIELQNNSGSTSHETVSQLPSMITTHMDASEVVSRLVVHGCQDITGKLDPSSFSDYPVSHGAFGDIYQGRLSNGTRVAVKVLRASLDDTNRGSKHMKHAARELHTWTKCNHPNIIPLLGLAIFRDRIGSVSPWMGHGSLPRYLAKLPGVDRLEMCVQICEGLSYLHQIRIIHCDLKGATVLVSDEGIPMLSDFGNSTLIDRTLVFTETTSGLSFSLRWLAPEVLQDTTGHTEASDVYALGMTIYETVTGKVPYHGEKDFRVLHLVSSKVLPKRPKAIPNDAASVAGLWELLNMCWSFEPAVRPRASDVLETLKKIQATSAQNREMSAEEIVSHLAAHDWVNLSNRLNLASFSARPVPHDGVGDVYRGQLMDGAAVAVKVHQISIDRNNLASENLKCAVRALYMWSRCKHPNTISLLGLAVFRGHIGIVVPWTNNESLPKYLKVVPGVNRYNMCVQICEGLTYLHRIGIIHGELKASNILVSHDGKPLLFDLGGSWLTKRTMDFTWPIKYSPESLRWTSPEVIRETTSRNESSDIYALGMTLYEVMTGKVPYYEQSDAAITLLVVQKGEPPERPESIPDGHETTDRLWELLLRCWSFEPTARPSAADVMEAVKGLQAAVVLTRKMAAQEVISHLIAHGCPDLSNELDTSSFADYPYFQGGLSDVYQGQLLDGSTVAVKVLHVSLNTINLGSKHLKQAARELHTWNRCRHPNIMPLLGLAVFRERIGMVSPWMKNGNLPNYLKETPWADRYNLCIQLCEGLSYLHRIQIVHCDLKGANVLVSDEGTPLLTDFGTSLVLERTLRFTATTSGTSYTLRWSPAEILQETSGHTPASDIYALGMTIYEAMTGKVPFHGKGDPNVILQVVKGTIPERLECMPVGDKRADKMWELLGRCWSYQPEERPTADEVTEALKEIAE